MNDMEKKYYVSMTDKLLSGWGQAFQKIAKIIVVCNSWREAQIIVDGISNTKDNDHMSRVNICHSFPRYPDTHKVTVKNFEECTLYIRNSQIK